MSLVVSSVSVQKRTGHSVLFAAVLNVNNLLQSLSIFMHKSLTALTKTHVILVELSFMNICTSVILHFICLNLFFAAL